MIEFVLEHGGEESRDLDRLIITLLIEIVDPDVLGTLHVAHHAGYREASLPVACLVVAKYRNPGIHVGSKGQ